MTKPKAYEPQDGYRYQIFCRNSGREWEHCDYATDSSDRKHLLSNYRMAYGVGWEFKWVTLPVKYWPKPDIVAKSTVCTNIRGMQGVIGVEISTITDLVNKSLDELRKMQDELIPQYNNVLQEKRRSARP